MSVPEYYELYRPLLEILNEGSKFAPGEIYGPLAAKINDIAGMQRVALSEGGHKFLNRVNWARVHLREAGLLEEDENFDVSISKEGKRVLSSHHDKIDNDFLMQYQSFFEFKNEELRQGITDEEDIDDDSSINKPRVESTEDWIEILQNEMEEKKESRIVPILRYYVPRPNFEHDMNSVEKAFGIGGLNLKIGRFGNRVIKQTGIPRQLRESNNPNGKERFYNIPFKGRYLGKKYVWRLRPELVDALLILDEATQGFIERATSTKIDTNVDLELVEWDYEQSNEPRKRDSRTPRKLDYDSLSEVRRDIGSAGEELVLRYERNRLKDCGRHDLSEMVRWVSKEDGDGLGYDISSFDANGNKRLIEVKSTTSSVKRLQFYISDNEAEKYFDDENLFIYFVFDIRKNPKLHIVNRERFKREFLVPSQYRVNVKVVEHSRRK